MEVGDKIVFLGLPLDDIYKPGVYSGSYENLVIGNVYTIRYKFNTNFGSIQLEEGHRMLMYLPNYFILFTEYRRIKLLKLKEKIYVGRTGIPSR